MATMVPTLEIAYSECNASIRATNMKVKQKIRDIGVFFIAFTRTRIFETHVIGKFANVSLNSSFISRLPVDL